MLRATCCVICGELLPKPGRLNRRYCRKSCRAVAYRARHREDRPGPALRRSPPGDSEVTRSLLYTRIPREVLDVLARHFDQQRESLAAELTAARTRIVELEKTSATEPAGAAALEDRRRFEAQVQQLRGELTETRSSLTAQLETAKRQLREASDLRAQAEQVPKLKTEMERINAELDNARAVAATSADEKRRLESDLQQIQDALTESRGMLTAQLEAAKRNQELTERSLRVTEQRCDALKGQLADAKAVLSKYEQNNDEEQKTHAAALAASAARLASLQTQYTDLKQENERLRDTAKAQRDERDDELAAAQERAAALRQEKETWDSQMVDIKRVLGWESQKASEAKQALAQSSTRLDFYRKAVLRLVEAINSGSRERMLEVRRNVAAALTALTKVSEPETIEAITESAGLLQGDTQAATKSASQTALVLRGRESASLSTPRASDTDVTLRKAQTELAELKAKYSTASRDLDEARVNLTASELLNRSLARERDQALHTLNVSRRQAAGRESEVTGKARRILEKFEIWAESQNPLTVEAHSYVGPYDVRKDKLIHVLHREIVDHAKLARAQWLQSKPVTAHLFNLDLTALQQAQAMAMAERWRMYADPPEPFDGKVTWEKFGYLLNPEAERFLCQISDKRGFDAWWQRLWFEPTVPASQRRK